MSSTESPRATLATRAVAMSSWILSQPIRPSTRATDKQRRQDGQHGEDHAAKRQGQHEQDADRRPEERPPLGGDDRLGRPGHQERETGQVRGGAELSTAAAVAWRKIRDLSGAGCCSFMRIKMRVWPASAFQKLRNSSSCGEAAISSSLSASRRSCRSRGQGGQPPVRVEHRGQREHLGDRLRGR